MKGELFNEAVQLACASMGMTGCEVVAITVVDTRSETRLRFNAPTASEQSSIRATVRAPSGKLQYIEIEAIFWVMDREWEVWDCQVDGALRRD